MSLSLLTGQTKVKLVQKLQLVSKERTVLRDELQTCRGSCLFHVVVIRIGLCHRSQVISKENTQYAFLSINQVVFAPAE